MASFFGLGGGSSAKVLEPVMPIQYDRYTSFDGPVSDLTLTIGETLIDCMDDVEDTKGNNGQRGLLTITNLRLIWRDRKNKSINLSIGLNSVHNVLIKTTQSKLRGTTQALFVIVQAKASRFEFIFTNLGKDNARLFTNVQTVVKAYQSSRLYRDLKLRGNFFKEKQLELLPRERLMMDVITGVWNLAGDQGHLGAMHVTNLRIIWQSMVNEGFNMSLPYLQITDIHPTTSKYGKAIVVETTPLFGPYTLGFRVDPISKLDELLASVDRQWREFLLRPDYGIDVVMSAAADESDAGESNVDASASPTVPSQTQRRVSDDVQIVDENERYFRAAGENSVANDVEASGSDVAASYAVAGSAPAAAAGAADSFMFDTYLGLMVERPQRPGVTLQQLWNLA